MLKYTHFKVNNNMVKKGYPEQEQKVMPQYPQDEKERDLHLLRNSPCT